ncbi:MAG: sigma-70 family RNA polymerase sigma factor, partial [Acidobacteriota bacterium]
YNVGTLDTAANPDDLDVAADRRGALAVEDRGFDDTEDREVVAELLERRPERERGIVRLRFYEQMSQSEIGDVIGISQMHVSRLLRRSFAQMREWVDDPEMLTAVVGEDQSTPTDADARE